MGKAVGGSCAVVGPGALGLLFAAGLGAPLLDYRPDRAERLRRSGVRVLRGEAESRHCLSVCSDPSALGAAPEWVLFAVKAYSLESALSFAAPLFGGGAFAVTLQNGIGNAELLASRFGAERVLAGSTSEGAWLVREGSTRHAGAGRTTVGALRSVSSGSAFRFASVLRGAGFDAEASPDWESAVWSKAAVNAAVNPLTALLGVQNGAVARSEPLRRLAVRIVEECSAAARARGVSVPPDLSERMLEVCRKTAENRSSMLQDVSRGSRTELEQINGALLREAAAHGVAAPVLEAVTNLARALVGGVLDRRIETE